MKVYLIILSFIVCSGFIIPGPGTGNGPKWYRPSVYSSYIDFYDESGKIAGRLAYNPASSRAHFTSEKIALRFQTKGFFDGEIKIARKKSHDKVGVIRKVNKKRNTLQMADGTIYRIDLKEMTISEDDMVLLQFQEKNKNEFIVQSRLHNEEEMLLLNAVLMYGRIAWVYGEGS